MSTANSAGGLLLFCALLTVISAQSFLCEVDEPAVKFYLLNITDKPTLFLINNASDLDPNVRTYFIVHGWREFPTKKLNFQLGETIARNEPSNVVFMDYSRWSRKLYACAGYMVQDGGMRLGKFIAKSARNYNISVDNVHIIGHSLGAHVSGYAGRVVQKHLNESVLRITALDAAGPLFTSPFRVLPELAIRSTDATIVDALHTTALIGTDELIGTADFYAVTTDSIQPACVDDTYIGCSHWVSRKYYIESITSCGIKAFDVDDDERVVTYGHHMPDNTTGTFDFYPKASPPYGRFKTDCT